MERTLMIKGVGKLSINPDLVIINFPIETQDLNYGTAVDELNKSVKLLRDTIESLGVDRKKVKTQDFRVETITRWNKNTEQDDFLGFSAQHDLILEIPFDNTLTNKIITNIVKLDSRIKFSISFGVQDQESCTQNLIENAIKNAKEKAKIIVNASDVELKEILNIEYSISNLHFRSNTSIFSRKSTNLSLNSMPDFIPTDIDISENVTITWRIE